MEYEPYMYIKSVMTSRHNEPYSNHTYPVVVFQNKRSKVNLHCYQNQREDKTNLILVHRFELTDNFIYSSYEWVFLPASVWMDWATSLRTMQKICLGIVELIYMYVN